jgi:hypothetical protein
MIRAEDRGGPSGGCRARPFFGVGVMLVSASCVAEPEPNVGYLAPTQVQTTQAPPQREAENCREFTAW